MQEQLTRIALGRRGYPDARKTIAQQQIEQMSRVARVGLVLAYDRSANLYYIAHLQLVPVASQQALEPLRRARRVHTDQRSSRQRLVERFGLLRCVTQPSLYDFAGRLIERGDLLISRMKITTYNSHRSAPFLRALVVKPN